MRLDSANGSAPRYQCGPHAPGGPFFAAGARNLSAFIGSMANDTQLHGLRVPSAAYGATTAPEHGRNTAHAVYPCEIHLIAACCFKFPKFLERKLGWGCQPEIKRLPAESHRTTFEPSVGFPTNARGLVTMNLFTVTVLAIILAAGTI